MSRPWCSAADLNEMRQEILHVRLHDPDGIVTDIIEGKGCIIPVPLKIQFDFSYFLLNRP